MIIHTPLHGVEFIPDERQEVEKELILWKERYLKTPSSYIQSRIDSLEFALDIFRRKEDV